MTICLKLILWSVLPLVAQAGMTVEVMALRSTQDSFINMVGSSNHIITDVERRTFRIIDSTLKEAVRRAFGRAPNDVYVRSPTPWNDLFATYGWAEVRTNVVPRSVRILDITSQPVAALNMNFINNSSNPGIFSVGIRQTLEQSVSTTWSSTQELSIGQEISYSVGVVNGSTSFSFTSTWGRSTMESETVTIGSANGVSVELDAGQAVRTELSVNRGTMRLEVEYEATLTGTVACNYNPRYQSPNGSTAHHFYGLPIGFVMNGGGLPQILRSTEILNVSFFSEGKITVYDSGTGRQILEVPATIIS